LGIDQVRIGSPIQRVSRLARLGGPQPDRQPSPRDPAHTCEPFRHQAQFTHDKTLRPRKRCTFIMDRPATPSFPIHLAMHGCGLLKEAPPMAAIGRFQKGDEIFYAKVVDGELFRLQGDVFGSPSYQKKPVALKGVKTLTPVAPSKIIAVGLNYA